jgi:dipeptidyl aminopeptidase/acylaminoacyl peptidase
MKNSIIILFIAIIPIMLGAQESNNKPLQMTSETLWELGRVSLDHVSNGKALFGVTNYNLEKNKGNRELFIADLKSNKTTQLTDSKTSKHSGFLVRGGNSYVYIQKDQLYISKIHPGNAEKGKKLTAIKGGIGNAKIVELDDGRILLTFSKRVKLDETPLERHPDKPMAEYSVHDDLMYRHWDRWTDYSYNHIAFSIIDLNNKSPKTNYTDIMAGEKFHSPMPPFGGSESFDISANGRYILYASKKLIGKDFTTHTNSKIYLYDRETKRTSTLNGLEGYDNNPTFSPDGQNIAFTAMPEDGYESDVNQLYVIPRDQSGEKRAIIPIIPAEYINSYKWIDNKTIIYNETTEATQQIRRLDLIKGKNGLAARRTKELTNGDFNYGEFGVSGDLIITERQDHNNATEIFKINSKKYVSPAPLTKVNKGIYDSIEIGNVEKRWISTSDGKKMLTWVFFPPNFDAEKKYPTLLYCQGGPQAAISSFYSFRWNFQLMAAKGYIVVAPNRHGVPGFGKEWNEQISNDWGGQAMRDYLAAIDTLAQESYVDENKLGAIGASYGGYSVYMLAGIHNNRFKALISHCGLFNMESWYLSTEEMFFANKDVGGPYWQANVPKAYTEFNPRNFVQNWTAPLLVIHGGKDFRVPVNQGIEAYQAAQLRGIPSRFLHFQNEGHWILNPQNGLVWHTEFFSWLDKWLKD